MKNMLLAAFCIIALISCKSEPKEIAENIGTEAYTTYYGLWSGDFMPVFDENDTTAVDDSNKKITIKINRIIDNVVEGQSIVSGYIRPLKGEIKKSTGGSIMFLLDEPGTNKYDGRYTLTLADGIMTGSFMAFKNNPDVTREKKLELKQKQFVYNPSLMLEDEIELVDWDNPQEQKISADYYDGEAEDEEDSIAAAEEAVAENEAVAKTDTVTADPEEEPEEYVEQVYRMASDQVYKINASLDKLNEAQLKNLTKLDLEIIRNCIFARHGYSFKKNNIRRFFEYNSWYVPVSNNVDNQLTATEKANIALLTRMEKYAEDHYDYFGR